MPPEVEKAIRRADRLVEKIGPILAGQNPEVVGAALGELAAILIAGHAPGQLRRAARALLIEVIDNLVPVIVEQMIEDGRAPEWWRDAPKH